MTDKNRMPVRTRGSARKKAEVAAFQASVYPPSKDESVVLGPITNITNLHANPEELQGKPKKERKRDKTSNSTADKDRIPLTRAAVRKKAEAAVEAFQASVLPPTEKKRVVLCSIANMTDLNTKTKKLQGKPKNESNCDTTLKSMAGQKRMHVTMAATEKRAAATAAAALEASSLQPAKKKRVVLESIINNPNLCGEPENKSKSVKKHTLHHIDGGKPDDLENVHTSEVEECKRKESRIRQRKNAKNAFFVHEDIVFNILVFLPAECLHNTMRHVTDSWAEMIHSRSFIDAHLKHVKPVLYFRSLGCDHHLEFMGGQVPRLIDTSQHSQGKLFAACDGLLLHLKGWYVEVLNPITMQNLSIPVPDYLSLFLCNDSFALNRVRHSGEFKVVRAYRDKQEILNWCVLTLGSNEWRHIFPPGFREGRYRNECPLISIGDFVFMPDAPSYGQSTSLIAMDLSKESFHVIKFPESVGGDGMSLVACHKMRKCLSLFVKNMVSPWSSDLEIYSMKDIPNGEWIKYMKLSSNQQFEVAGRDWSTYWSVQTCGWLDDGRWMILGPRGKNGGFRVYDRKSHKVYQISTTDLTGGIDFCEQHTPSLVWWES